MLSDKGLICILLDLSAWGTFLLVRTELSFRDDGYGAPLPFNRCVLQDIVRFLESLQGLSPYSPGCYLNWTAVFKIPPMWFLISVS